MDISKLGRLRGLPWTAGAIVVLTVLLARAARADITIIAPTLTLPYSTSVQTGSFEVYVQSTASPEPQVGNFGVEIQLPSFSTVKFSIGSLPTAGSETTPTVHPYIYNGQQPTEVAVGSGRTVEGGDFAESAVPTLSNGVGLLLVPYSIPAGATGYYPLTFLDYSKTNPVGTGLFDDANPTPNLIPSTDQNGSIAILPPTAYWQGTVDGTWTTDDFQTGVTNWTIDAAATTDTHIAPGVSTDVFFTGSGATHLTTTLGSDFSIKGLTFTATATDPVTIGGNTLTLGADGLTVEAGSGSHTIAIAVVLGGEQTWQIGNGGSSPLTVSGTLDVPAAASLTKTGAGALVLSGAPTWNNGSSLVVSGGSVKFDVTAGTPTVGTGVTASVAPGATLELAGTVSALAAGAIRANVANDSSAADGGLVISGTNQQLGNVTGTGDLTIAAGGDLTANSIQQTTLILAGTADNPATLTIPATDAAGLPLDDGIIGSLASSEPSVGDASVSIAEMAAPMADVADPLQAGVGGPTAAGSAVPEPSSFVLAGMAIVGWLAAGRKRQRKMNLTAVPPAAEPSPP